MEKLLKIQTELKAPKNQKNTFGKYSYRSCEDILEALKPLLKATGCLLYLSDEMVEVGGRVYVKATATITDGEKSVVTTAYAREPESRKGMDESQITGAASSYARKYSLNALFLIDDTKDADAMNDPGEGPQEKQNYKKVDPKPDPFKGDALHPEKEYYLNNPSLTDANKQYIRAHKLTYELKAWADAIIDGQTQGEN